VPKKVVLAYSGGLDTSIIIPWLKGTRTGCEVIAMVATSASRKIEGSQTQGALDRGVLGHDRRPARRIPDPIHRPTLRAGAVYEHKYLLGTSMARPVLAKRQAEIALETGC